MKNSKRHSKPCVYFQTNTCPLTANECDYAHVTATPEQLELLQNPQATLRTKPCRFYLAGQCKDGYWCRFKHPVNTFAASTTPLDGGLHDETNETGSDAIKKGYADVRELEGAWRAKPDQHPKYRTRPCRNFLLGRCTYGERCSYLHENPPPSSPMSSLPSPPASYLISPATSYFPVTPPHRVPNSTPISSSDLDTDMTDLDHAMLASMALARSGHRTPSNSSDEPGSPESPATPGGNEYPSYQPFHGGIPGHPLSPVSPFSHARHPYAKKSIMDAMSMSVSGQPPLSPPYSMYSSTSPVQMTIVHVPVAVPMYQSMHGDERKSTIGAQRPRVSRPRASSQPDVDHGKFAPRNVNFRSKPCRFYNDFGRCHKGDNCNFIHSPDSRHASLNSNCTSRRESISAQEKQAAETPIQRAPSPPKENPNNFYKINWRVLGGGVKIASNNSVLRRHSEDASAFPRESPNFRTMFPPSASNQFMPNSQTCLAAPFELKQRADSLCTPSTESCNYSSKNRKIQKRADNALALTLQSYSLSGASAAPPIVILQDGEESLDWGDNYDDGDEGVIATADLSVPTAQSRIRARSSPSSPVTAHAELPTLLFSAESP